MSAKAGVGRPVFREQQIRKADNGGQNIVEIMSHAARQLPDRLHLLALGKLGFQRLVLGSVERIDDEPAIAPARL